MSREIVGSLLVLRELESTFVTLYLQALSDYLMEVLAISTREAERTYLEAQLAKVATQETFFFCIFERISDLFIGAIEIRPPHYRSQLYNWINEQFWGNGYYQEALGLALTHYFEWYPDEQSVQARVDVTNLRSFYALKKFGFIENGIFAGPRGPQYELLFARTALVVNAHYESVIA